MSITLPPTFVGMVPGYAATNRRMLITIDLPDEPRSGATAINTRHEEVPMPCRLSIMGEIQNLPRTDSLAAGSGLSSELLDIDPKTSPLTQDELLELARVWRRWHLNDMRPNCMHQVFTDGRGHQLAAIDRYCPVTGYVYGSAWLVEEIPATVVEFLHTIAAKLEA